MADWTLGCIALGSRRELAVVVAWLRQRRVGGIELR
jgi:hypothetical protein